MYREQAIFLTVMLSIASVLGILLYGATGYMTNYQQAKVLDIRGDQCLFVVNGERHEQHCLLDKGDNVTIYQDLFGDWYIKG